MTDQTPEAGSQQLIAGRYRLGEEIGRGGRSIVYAAHDPLLHRDVAVKIFTAAATTPDELRIQEAEARLAAGMNHHALTTLFDAGIDSAAERAQVFLVMERIPGVDLRQHLRLHGPLSPAQVAYLGFDLAEGLQYVHEHGFLHRDIKPANVLIADRRVETRVRGKLSDFGIASIIGLPDDGEHTSGTAAYLAPEQVDGQDPTPASDVYALGLVLLEATTGRRAYPGHAEESAFARLDHDPHIPDGVPPALAAILRGMTALLPEDRPDLSATALAFQRVFIQDLVASGRIDASQLSEDEERRVAAVRRYDILDTPPDDAFDRITHLVCRLLGVPVAFISLVDADREWIKSRRGMDLAEIDRDRALCAVVVTSDAPLVIEDVRADARWLANPIVQNDPTLRAFAAVPMRTHDGHLIGTLCVFDRRVRAFTAEEIDDLDQFAAVAMRELDLRLASRRAVFSGR